MHLAFRYYFIWRLLVREGFTTGKDALVEIGSGASGIGEFCDNTFMACDLKFSANISENLLPVSADVMCLPFKDNSFDKVISPFINFGEVYRKIFVVRSRILEKNIFQ